MDSQGFNMRRAMMFCHGRANQHSEFNLTMTEVSFHCSKIVACHVSIAGMQSETALYIAWWDKIKLSAICNRPCIFAYIFPDTYISHQISSRPSPDLHHYHSAYSDCFADVSCSLLQPFHATWDKFGLHLYVHWKQPWWRTAPVFAKDLQRQLESQSRSFSTRW